MANQNCHPHLSYCKYHKSNTSNHILLTKNHIQIREHSENITGLVGGGFVGGGGEYFHFAPRFSPSLEGIAPRFHQILIIKNTNDQKY